MISKECFTASWIDQKSKELQYNDKNIIECKDYFKKWMFLCKKTNS